MKAESVPIHSLPTATPGVPLKTRPVVPAPPEAPGDRVALTGDSPLPAPASGPSETETRPQQEAPPREQPAPPSGEVSWILGSASQTAYAGEPSVERIRRRFPSLPEAVQNVLSLPFLDALTQSDGTRGRELLDRLDDTLAWAQKFKKKAGALAASGYEALAAEAARARENNPEPTALEGVLASADLVFSSPLSPERSREADHLLEQFRRGNQSPGIGTKGLEQGVLYLRGRHGTRIFFKWHQGEPRWLAVCDKSTEQKAIAQVRQALK